MTDAQIAGLLATLETLLNRIAPVRRQAAALLACLTEVQRDYDRHVGQANAEADRMEQRKRALRARLDPQWPPPMPLPPSSPAPTPPPLTFSKSTAPGSLPSSLPENPRAVRKRALADHIFYFAEIDQSDVMQYINAMAMDERRDIGDMLELLSWGEIWKARAEWELLETQFARLDGWRVALEERLAYWQVEVKRLEEDERHPLWSTKQKMSREEWGAYLDGLARDQMSENARLADEIRKLERQLLDKQKADK